ncbi:MAG: Trp family transcriptional regulator [Patescibacteria group bacterium]
MIQNMPHVSRKKLPDKILRQILETFLYVLTDIKEKERMAKFLDSFLSSTEKLMLAKRLAIAFLLSEGVEESKIAETLNVTRPTVSRMRLYLETRGLGFKPAFEKIRKFKMLAVLKDFAIKATAKAIRWAGGRP